MKLQPYPEYKDSGLPWLGSIPQHWDCLPHRAIFEEIKEQGHVNEPLLSVTIGRGIIRQEDLLANSSKKDSSNLDKSKYKLVEPGDIAYNKMRAWQGAVGVSRYRGIVSPAYIVQRLRGESRPEYFHYLFRTPGFAKEAERWSYGITSDQWSLRPQHFKMIYSCAPPLEEQELIVGFLRGLDRQVRRFIRNRRRLIEVLNEQKQAIINRAVTRGLDPNAALKPSGVDWIGDIPEHWEVLSVKHVLRRLIDCEHKTAPATEDSKYLVVRTSAVRDGSLRLEGTYCTTATAFSEWTKRGVPEPGDIIFTREAPAGEACIVPDGISLCLGQRTVLMKVRRDTYNPRFLVHMIYGGPPRDRIQLTSQGSTVGHFNIDDIGWMPVLKPPLNEQVSIIDAIARDTHETVTLIARAKHEIDLIREYRTRLISDVVTGKVDVRHLAPPPGSEDLEEMVEALEPLDDEPGETDEEPLAGEVKE